MTTAARTSASRTSSRAMSRATAFEHEVAISAVGYDTLLVRELSDALAGRLSSPPLWLGHRADDAAAPTTIVDDRAADARVLLLLHQRLWQQAIADADVATLRERVTANPSSVVVVLLDDQAAPEWLAGVQQCALGTVGVQGVAQVALDVVTTCGGVLQDPPAPAEAAAAPRLWNDAPRPFLSQPRAASSLRSQLDALAAELKPHIKRREEVLGDGARLHSLPNRLIAQLGTAGVSFSWLGGSSGNVSDGRLLVIEWTGLKPHTPREAVLRAATQVRERVYRAEAAGPDSWRWRTDVENGQAYSTADLAREWMDGAGLGEGAN